MTFAGLVRYVERVGVVQESGRAKAGRPVSLTETIAGAPIRGSWWGHPAGQRIFELLSRLRDREDVVVCKLLNDRVTYVHRRLWPALVVLAPRIGKARLAQVISEHTESGAHRSRRVPFPRWVPQDVEKAAAKLAPDEADAVLPAFVSRDSGRRTRSHRR